MSGLCRHSGICGGCAYQDLDDTAYRAVKRERVIAALHRNGVDASLAEMVESAPATRRRATLKAKKTVEGVLLGFHGVRSHAIVDQQECRVLTPRLSGLLPGLRTMLADVLENGDDADLRLTDSDTGVDLGLRWRNKADTETIATLARWAGKLKLVRITANGETLVTLGAPAVQLGKASVGLPPEAFLQPTRDGEAALQAFVCETLKGVKRVADLFAGCGTFTFVLAERARVHAVELEAGMLEVLAAAVKATSGLKPITNEKRNLFKRPLTALELNAYDAVCLDPPRAGALDQAMMLAKSKLQRVAYISCDADTFARDARVLVEGGFALQRLVPVDQFLWSTHIELAAAFVRP